MVIKKIIADCHARYDHKHIEHSASHVVSDQRKARQYATLARGRAMSKARWGPGLGDPVNRTPGTRCIRLPRARLDSALTVRAVSRLVVAETKDPGASRASGTRDDCPQPFAMPERGAVVSLVLEKSPTAYHRRLQSGRLEQEQAKVATSWPFQRRFYPQLAVAVNRSLTSPCLNRHQRRQHAPGEYREGAVRCVSPRLFISGSRPSSRNNSAARFINSF